MWRALTLLVWSKPPLIRFHLSLHDSHCSNCVKSDTQATKMPTLFPTPQWPHRERPALPSNSNESSLAPSGMLQPINRRAYASVTNVPNNEASLYMSDFSLDTPSFVTLASSMKMRACEVFWRRVHVQLICSREHSSEQCGIHSAVLCIRRRRRHGCLGSSSLAISLDRRMYPVQLLSTKAKDAHKLMIGIEYGWRARHAWFRAPNVEVYEQWLDVIRSALQGYSGHDEEQSLAKWVERSGVSMMETATTSAIGSIDRFSTDSYARGCSTSYRSDIPDEEWSAEDEAVRRECYLSHGMDSKTSFSAHNRNNRERTDTVNWLGRPAFCFTEPDNMRYDNIGKT